MSYIRPMHVDDLYTFNNVNFDQFTETFQPRFYHNYLIHWPEMCSTLQSSTNDVIGYMIAKSEGHNDEHHGHVSAVTVDPLFRRQGAARRLMAWLEGVSEQYRAWFVDLFVKKSNTTALEMYSRLGYSVYREIEDYYSTENALDLRKVLSRDSDKQSLKIEPSKRVIAREDYVEFKA
eukprot:gnl/Dysnectes_brevis/5860_a8708_642.p1 GENE.gnl/Dysnectes_brevis/5860_a8708_642~~gnl/Dysnectes_brevis/5860_a8708_642.p1  ORF type:complete len:177 (+),score=3.48 gnl/Dysnectes_brevis/5860_a8708_642:49-579(+)